MPRSPQLTFDDVRRIAHAFPGVEDSTSYGTPSLKVNGRFMARLREDGATLALKCGFEERDLRLQASPDVFFSTPHYAGYPTVLIRLDRVRKGDLTEVIEVAWRRLAPRRAVAAFDALPR
jgi:hypothetical protein